MERMLGLLDLRLSERERDLLALIW
jgi:hypothetical protein